MVNTEPTGRTMDGVDANGNPIKIPIKRTFPSTSSEPSPAQQVATNATGLGVDTAQGLVAITDAVQANLQRTKDDEGRTVLVDAATGKAGVVTRDGVQPLSSADAASLDTSKMQPATTTKVARTFPGGPAKAAAPKTTMPTGSPKVARTWTGK